MIIENLEIANFKSFGSDPISFPLRGVTAFVGENNSGKSNALTALDLFRHYSKKKMQKSYFHASDPTKAINIKITYGQLTNEEKMLFRRHLGPDETLTITQTIGCSADATDYEAGPETSESVSDESVENITEEKKAFYARSSVDWLDSPPTTKTQIKKLWAGEMKIGDVDFKDWTGLDPNEPPTKEDLGAKIEEFWNEYWELIPKQEEETGTSPLGWPNKLTGNLPEVVFIPAVKNVSEEARTTKTSPFGSLLNWLVSSIQADLRSEMQAKLDTLFNEALASLPKEIDEERGDEVTRLDLINRTLNKHLIKAFGASLKVDFKKPEVDSTIFGETILSADDGFPTEITEKGHGLQRAAMMAIIRTYLQLRSRLEAKIPGLGRVIFLVEEPEIYLHPTMKRSSYSLFRQLAKGGDQVIYSTHDGYFIDVLNFSEIRYFRKEISDPAPRSLVDFVTEKTFLDVWKKLSGRDDIEIASVKERLRNLYNLHRNEGFLSKTVILCEGPTESSTFPLYFDAIGYDLNAYGVSVVDAGNVNLLDILYLLFTEFGIPIFVIWDGDKPDVSDITALQGQQRSDIEKKSNRNKMLISLIGATLTPRANGMFFSDFDEVWDNCTMLSSKYETSIMNTLPDSAAVKQAAKDLYGTDSKPMLARYYAWQVIDRGQREGDRSKYVPEIFKKIKEKLLTLQPAPKQSSLLT